MSTATLSDRWREERQFHDAQAAARWQDLSRAPAQRLRVDETAYLNHEPWIKPAFAMLGDVAGLQVLDYGCGHGMAGTLLARRGAFVTAFDLSGRYVQEAQARARVNEVAERFRTVQAVGEQLPFATGSFDRVWGHAILHHLDLTQALPEIRRVLKPGGVAVFCEPWAGNPLLAAARRWLPYPGKHRSRDEEPLRPEAIAELRGHFTAVAVQPFQLLGMIRRALPGQPRLGWLKRLDAGLLRALPFLGRWGRYVVIRAQA